MSREATVNAEARFVKWAMLGMITLAGFYAVRPDTPPAVPMDVQQQAAARQVLAWQIGDPARGTRALNRCMPAAFDRTGKVDWIYVRGCYDRTR
jgi:hypothetical protein